MAAAAPAQQPMTYADGRGPIVMGEVCVEGNYGDHFDLYSMTVLI